jgi:hypothetical protein
VDPRENTLRERLFEGSQTESALRHRPRHPEKGGLRPLRDLPVDHQTLAEKEAPNGRCENVEKIPGRPSLKGRALREWLPSHLKSNPDLTLAEHCRAFEEGYGIEVSQATMSRNIARLPGEWPLKKSRT